MISYGYSVLIKSNMVNPKIDFRILILVILFMTVGLVIIWMVETRYAERKDNGWYSNLRPYMDAHVSGQVPRTRRPGYRDWPYRWSNICICKFTVFSLLQKFQ